MLDSSIFTQKDLRDVFGAFPTGVCIVTGYDQDNKLTGITINSFSSLSLDPALCAFSIGKDKYSTAWLQLDSELTINILSSEQGQLAWDCAKYKNDTFNSIDTFVSERVSVPSIEGSLGFIECHISKIVDAGDHWLYICKIVAVRRNLGDPLVFFSGKMKSLKDQDATASV
jgi:flavin reductase (DIM6/NTAB) family NADH-FMN oxidoreductase RutF